MAHKPDDKRDDKDDKKDAPKVDTKSNHPDAPKSPLAHGDLDPRAEATSGQRAGQVGATGASVPPPLEVRPTLISPTSDKLQAVVELHAEVFSPDELAVLSSAVTELKDYEVLTGPPPAPVVRDVPYVAQEGPLLTCTMGNWENEPTDYSYGWHRDGTFVIAAPGPAGSSYTVMTEDVGKTFTCVVTATNASGDTVAPPSNGVVVTDPLAARANRA